MPAVHLHLLARLFLLYRAAVCAIEHSIFNTSQNFNGSWILVMTSNATCRVGANAWVNIPHKASDAFIASFAAFLRDRLRPDLKVYVEYSNEGE